MDVQLSIDEQEIWEQRWRKLEALMGSDPSQRQHDPTQSDKIMDPQLFSVAKKEDVDKFIKDLEDHCTKERVSLPVLLGLRSPSENTLLHAAIESDNNVKAVINFVPEDLISYKNSRGETPLHIAARAGRTGVVELLLDRANPTCPDHSGNSPMHEAVRNRRYEVIRRLLSADPNPLYRQNKESKSPWCLAVEIGDLEVLRILLEEPNDSEDQRRSESGSVFGMSPVHVAVMYKKMDMLTMMWEKKPWLFQLKDAGHGTPLHLAAYRNYVDGVKFLIDKFPTSALEQDSACHLPIHVACMMDCVGIMKELLGQWPDPAEFLAGRGQNILHVSARHGSPATVKYILKDPKFGHLINAKDFDGNTPLHLAALHCQPTVVLLSRDRRVDLKLVNNNNMTALDVVEQDTRVIKRPLAKSITCITLESAGTRRSGELAICKPTGRSPWKRQERPELDGFRDQVDTCAIVAALVASVTFTSGFVVPGGYNGSHGDAGKLRSGLVGLLFRKAVMYNVFVICNSIALYSSVTALVILLCSYVNDPLVRPMFIFLSNVPLLISLGAMSWAFIAGVWMTVTIHAWLPLLVYYLGGSALIICVAIFNLRFVLLGGTPLIGSFARWLFYFILSVTGGGVAGSGTADREG